MAAAPVVRRDASLVWLAFLMASPAGLSLAQNRPIQEPFPELCSALPLEDVLAAVMQSMEQWSAPAGPSDDASILAIERYG